MFPDWLYCKAGSDLFVEHLHLMSLVLPVHIGSRLYISALHLPMVGKRETALAGGLHTLTSVIHSYLHLEASDH